MKLFALATINGGTGVTDVAKAVTDFGVTAVICAVIIVFLFKILNTMVNQIDATQQSVLPEIQKLGDQINSVRDTVIEAVTKHNTNTVNSLYSISTDIAKIKEDQSKMLAQLSEISAYIQRLDTNVDSEQLMLTQLSNELSAIARQSNALCAKLEKNQKGE